MRPFAFFGQLIEPPGSQVPEAPVPSTLDKPAQSTSMSSSGIQFELA